jgi:hypothetical protein
MWHRRFYNGWNKCRNHCLGSRIARLARLPPPRE